MGYQSYEPLPGTPLALIYENSNYYRLQDVAEHLEIATNTVRRWNEGENWPHWALEKMGFSVIYGEPEVQPLEELEHLRSRLDELINEYYVDEEGEEDEV